MFMAVTLRQLKHCYPLLLLVRGSHHQKLPSNMAYFRHIEGQPDFHVSFRYANKSHAVDKQFNFCRRISETAVIFTNRVSTNVEKIIDKKLKKRKTKEALSNSKEDARKIITRLLRNGEPTESDFLCVDMFKGSAVFSLQISDQEIPVFINSPWIETIALPKGIMAGFLVYPCKYESYFTDKDATQWTWYRSILPYDKFEQCGAGQVYNTSPSDVGCFIKVVCLPSNGVTSGPPVEATSPAKVEAGPGPLPSSQRHSYTTSRLDDEALRVVSYNILADLYVDSEYSRTVLFGYCPPYALELSYRKQLLLHEIIGYNADILCLQEVDSKVFSYDLVPMLSRHGFSGFFSQKGTTVNEGTSMFYNVSKLKLLKSFTIQLSDLLQNDPLHSDLHNQIKDNAPFLQRVTERSTTLQVGLLECLSKPGQLLMVANVHLYFHPDADHVRLFQAGLVANHLEFLRKSQQILRPDDQISVLWCGDFNSVPECGIYQLLTTGSVSSDHIDWKSNVTEAVSDVSFSNQLNLKSACGTPQFTNYTVGFKACLDYIFYETTRFKVEQVVPLPDEEVLSTHLAIPSVVFPSDHVALVADLRYAL